jgi:hypothetical protein
LIGREVLGLEVQAVVIHDHGRLDLELLRDAGDRVAILHVIERATTRRDQETLADAERRAFLGDAVGVRQVVELDLILLGDRTEVVVLHDFVFDDRPNIFRGDRDDAARSGDDTTCGRRHARAAIVGDARHRHRDGRRLSCARRAKPAGDGVRKRQHEKRGRDVEDEAKTARTECRRGECRDLVAEELDSAKGEISPQ